MFEFPPAGLILSQLIELLTTELAPTADEVGTSVRLLKQNDDIIIIYDLKQVCRLLHKRAETYAGHVGTQTCTRIYGYSQSI